MAQDITNNPEASKILYLIKTNNKVLNKFGWSNGPVFKDAVAKITAGANASKDPVAFLTKVLAKYDPGFKMLPPNTKVTPGKEYSISASNLAISPKGTKHLPSPEKQAQIKALQDKITAHNVEIERLRKQHEAAKRAADKTEAEHEKIKLIFDEKTLKYFAYIEENCGEYLKSVKATGKLLYRGQYKTSAPIFVGYPREDRHPKDSDLKAQELYDRYLSIMGFKALRSNSIFTTSDERQASGYGNTYAIFPKDGFSFTWSTKESDLVLNSQSQIDKKFNDPEGAYYEFNDEIDDFQYNIRLLMHYYNNKELQMLVKKSPAVKELSKAFRKWDRIDYSEHTVEEIYNTAMLVAEAVLDVCQKIPEVSVEMPKMFNKAKRMTTSIKKKVSVDTNPDEKASAAKMIKSFGLLDTKLESAIKSGHEVCILGEYVAVDANLYEEQITRYFLAKEKLPVAKKSVAKKSVAKKSVAKKKPAIKKNALKLFPEPATLGGNTNKKLPGSTAGFKT